MMTVAAVIFFPILTYLFIGIIFSVAINLLHNWAQSQLEGAPDYNAEDLVLFIVIWPLFIVIFIFSMLNQPKD